MGREKREELYVTVPSLFRCPISMDVMKSPVSLCTGVTYDRNSIQKWLSQGHNTCPATMQILPSTDVIPNLTLRNLIHLWLSDVTPTSSSQHLISRQQALHIIKNLSSTIGENKLVSLNKIADFLRFSQENRKSIASSDEAVREIIRVLETCDLLSICEVVIKILDLIFLSVDGANKVLLNTLILQNDFNILSRFVLVLRNGSLDSRIKSARVCEVIAINPHSQRKIAERDGLLHELYKLISIDSGRIAAEAGLSTILAVSTSRPVKKELVRFGIVRAVTRILTEIETGREGVPVIEKALKVLEVVATCTEGRAAIGEDEECVVEVTRKLMKCSGAATEHGITVVWSVCCMAREEKVKERVNKENGLTKVLLVMQSDCSAGVRQMCGDLVKVLRGKNGKSCLATYDTRTTHIMPY